MDNPTSESSQPLSLHQAAALFAGDPPEQEQPTEEAKATPQATAEAETAEAESTEQSTETQEEQAGADETITIEVDGKSVEVKKSELPDLYKNGLRQADYTKKTMEVAEQRKTAEAEASKAREERQKYAQGLQQAHAVLQAQLAEQDNINWHDLRDNNPHEFLKQWHLRTERQAQLQKIQGEYQQVSQTERAEAKKALVSRLQDEHQALLDKLPEWKDDKKAAAEKSAIVQELLERGFDRERILGTTDADGSPSLDNPGLADHKILLLARDAMLYRQMMSKAQAAAKKVTQLPQKVARPGGGEVQATDGRTAAMKQLQRSGSIRDAARVFEKLF